MYYSVRFFCSCNLHTTSFKSNSYHQQLPPSVVAPFFPNCLLIGLMDGKWQVSITFHLRHEKLKVLIKLTKCLPSDLSSKHLKRLYLPLPQFTRYINLGLQQLFNQKVIRTIPFNRRRDGQLWLITFLFNLFATARKLFKFIFAFYLDVYYSRWDFPQAATVLLLFGY